MLYNVITTCLKSSIVDEELVLAIVCITLLIILLWLFITMLKWVLGIGRLNGRLTALENNR